MIKYISYTPGMTSVTRLLPYSFLAYQFSEQSNYASCLIVIAVLHSSELNLKYEAHPTHSILMQYLFFCFRIENIIHMLKLLTILGSNSLSVSLVISLTMSSIATTSYNSSTRERADSRKILIASSAITSSNKSSRKSCSGSL